MLQNTRKQVIPATVFDILEILDNQTNQFCGKRKTQITYAQKQLRTKKDNHEEYVFASKSNTVIALI